MTLSFTWSPRLSLGKRTRLEMQEGARRLDELWVEYLMNEQIEALKKIWSPPQWGIYDRSFLGSTFTGCYTEPQP